MAEQTNEEDVLDFKELAEEFPSLAPFVKVGSKGPHLKWSDPNSVRELTKVLLKRNFDLNVELPADRLCPRLKCRKNYVLWVKELLQMHGVDSGVRGIDVGCGASCIFPLLGARMFGWTFVASEIDASSMEVAQRNVSSNKLEDSIELRMVPKSTRLEFISPRDGQFGFAMCNPPFYRKGETITPAPHTPPCQATEGERAVDGGEEKFVSGLIEDSVRLGTQVRWYSAMLGKKASMKPLYALLKRLEVSQVRSTVLLAGRTRRWAIAWSFHTCQLLPLPKDDQQRIDIGGTALGKAKPPSAEQVRMFQAGEVDVDEARRRLADFFVEHPLARRPFDPAMAEEVPLSVPFTVCSSEVVTVPLDWGLRGLPSTSSEHFEIRVDAGTRPRLAPQQPDDMAVDEEEGATCAPALKRRRVEEPVDAWIRVQHSSGTAMSLVFMRFVQSLQGDILRTNRKWRRRQKKAEME